ncbi:DASH complex subunit Dad2-domain-containing protein [Aspergillus leporis]|uniref:DASH complex subunit DAD2 n=1 Tax=Aspergillus leporis TaxID=41062 RepID=A0A5N5X2P1_9EURO|nr:DASH complex subunit Dad2-domain-containing protein [Aspergillus leporis]
MAYISRPTSMPPPASSSLRQPNTYLTVSQQQSSVLAARIASKKAELDNLKQLCEMSGALAMQMHSLEQKIGTLKDGTEAVACVLSNWDNVLRAISMASTKAANIQGPMEQRSSTGAEDNMTVGFPMPATLVRIPAERE